MSWYEDENKELDKVTISELEELCLAIKNQREECDRIKMEAKAANEKLDELEKKMMGCLSALGKNSYKSDVGLFTVTHRISVRVPQGDDKAAFFEWLKEKGYYDSYVTVNSQSLNSLYRQEFEKAKAEGSLDSFSIPGIGEPTINEVLSFRKA
jgi:hypothetical protein